MNEEPTSSPTNQQPQVLQHEKVITPLNPGVTPEEPISPYSAPPPGATNGTQPSIATQNMPAAPTRPTSYSPSAQAEDSKPITPSQNPPRGGKFSYSRYWVGKITRLTLAAVVGLAVGAAFMYYWHDGDILNRSFLAMHHYSPISLRYTIIPTGIAATIYGLVFRFVLKSRYGFGQAIFAFLATELAATSLLAIEHLQSPGVSILGEGVTIFTAVAALCGGIVFVAANHLAERVWTWRVSRAALASCVVALLLVASFGLGRAVHVVAGKKANTEAAASVAAKQDMAAGTYDYNGGYQQFLPSSALQKRFALVGLSSSVGAHSHAKDDYLHTTEIEFKDLNYKGYNKALKITMRQSKIAPSYKPPQNCGNPNPYVDYYDQQSKYPIYNGKCSQVTVIPGIGVLYARNQYVSDTDGLPKYYDWYYLMAGGTLITLDTLKATPSHDVVRLFSGLQPVSPSTLLAKSKTLAESRAH